MFFCLLLPHPPSILKYTFLSHIDRSEVDKDVDMVALDGSFRELLSVDSVLLPEGEMYSYFTFIEVDIGERILAGHSGIESESEFSDHDLALGFHDERVYLLEHRRKISRREDSPFFDSDEERGVVNHLEGIPGIGFYERFSVESFEVYGFGEEFPDGEGSTLVFRFSIVSGIPASSLHRPEVENVPLGRMAVWGQSSVDIGSEFLESVNVLVGVVFEGFLEGLELLFLDICQVIELDNMHSDIEELESDPERRESEIRGLHENDDGILGKSKEFRLDGFDLGIEYFCSGCLDDFMMIESNSYILLDIVRSNESLLLSDMRIVRIQKPSAIQGLRRIDKFSNDGTSWQNCMIGIRKPLGKRRFCIVEEVDLLS